LNVQSVWSLTRGAGIRVAVIDSGVNFSNPQLRGIAHAAGVSVIPSVDPGTRDCFGHGTAVAGLIAAQPTPNQAFTGVAPDVTIIPIKQTNTPDDKSGTAAGIAAGIEQAIRLHADVVNVSIAYNAATPAMAAAVADARAHSVIIVAAAGNDAQNGNAAAYPAAYAASADNVIAVSAVDRKDQVGTFSTTGNYVTVAAPGQGVSLPASFHGFFVNQSGTSYAAPLVTGTVALMLAAHGGHGSLTPAQVKGRLETSADAPPAAVPDPQYGYGVADPLLAVTSTGDGSLASTPTVHATPLPAPTAPRPASHHLRHLALALALVLGALALVVLVAAAVLRRAGTPPPRRRAAESDDAPGGALARR
jgi:type VII secretion-associated serine protease mycosin